MRQILKALAWHLQEAGKIDLSECFIDGTFVVEKKKGSKVKKTKRGKGKKLIVIVDAHGLPVAVHTASASPHEITLVEATIDETFAVRRP